MGITLAIFHSDGKIPDVMDLLKIQLSDSAIIGAASSINLHDMLSKPFSFLVHKEVMILKTSSVVTSCSEKHVFVGLINFSKEKVGSGSCAARFGPMSEKCWFRASATSVGSFKMSALIFTLGMFLSVFMFRDNTSLIVCHKT